MKVSKGLKNRDLLKKHKKQCKKQREFALFIAAGIKELGKRLGIKKGPGENIPSGQCGFVVKRCYSSKVTGPSARGLNARNQFGAAEVLIILLVINLVLPPARATAIGPEAKD